MRFNLKRYILLLIALLINCIIMFGATQEIPNQYITENPKKQVKTIKSKKLKENAELNIKVKKRDIKKIKALEVGDYFQLLLPKDEKRIKVEQEYTVVKKLDNATQKGKKAGTMKLSPRVKKVNIELIDIDGEQGINIPKKEVNKERNYLIVTDKATKEIKDIYEITSSDDAIDIGKITFTLDGRIFQFYKYRTYDINIYDLKRKVINSAASIFNYGPNFSSGIKIDNNLNVEGIEDYIISGIGNYGSFGYVGDNVSYLFKVMDRLDNRYLYNLAVAYPIDYVSKLKTNTTFIIAPDYFTGFYNLIENFRLQGNKAIYKGVAEKKIIGPIGREIVTLNLDIDNLNQNLSLNEMAEWDITQISQTGKIPSITHPDVYIDAPKGLFNWNSRVYPDLLVADGVTVWDLSTKKEGGGSTTYGVDLKNGLVFGINSANNRFYIKRVDEVKSTSVELIFDYSDVFLNVGSTKKVIDIGSIKTKLDRKVFTSGISGVSSGGRLFFDIGVNGKISISRCDYYGKYEEVVDKILTRPEAIEVENNIKFDLIEDTDFMYVWILDETASLEGNLKRNLKSNKNNARVIQNDFIQESYCKIPLNASRFESDFKVRYSQYELPLGSRQKKILIEGTNNYYLLTMDVDLKNQDYDVVPNYGGGKSALLFVESASLSGSKYNIDIKEGNQITAPQDKQAYMKFYIQDGYLNSNSSLSKSYKNTIDSTPFFKLELTNSHSSIEKYLNGAKSDLFLSDEWFKIQFINGTIKLESYKDDAFIDSRINLLVGESSDKKVKMIAAILDIKNPRDNGREQRQYLRYDIDGRLVDTTKNKWLLGTGEVREDIAVAGKSYAKLLKVTIPSISNNEIMIGTNPARITMWEATGGVGSSYGGYQYKYVENFSIGAQPYAMFGIATEGYKGAVPINIKVADFVNNTMIYNNIGYHCAITSDFYVNEYDKAYYSNYVGRIDPVIVGDTKIIPTEASLDISSLKMGEQAEWNQNGQGSSSGVLNSIDGKNIPLQIGSTSLIDWKSRVGAKEDAVTNIKILDLSNDTLLAEGFPAKTDDVEIGIVDSKLYIKRLTKKSIDKDYIVNFYYNDALMGTMNLRLKAVNDFEYVSPKDGVFDFGTLTKGVITDKTERFVFKYFGKDLVIGVRNKENTVNLTKTGGSSTVPVTVKSLKRVSTGEPENIIPIDLTLGIDTRNGEAGEYTGDMTVIFDIKKKS